MGIMTERRDWILAHVSHDAPGCLFYPFNADTSRPEYIDYGGRKSWSPSRLMCTLAKGPPPPGKRFALAACAGKLEGCIHPKHVRWMDGAERAKLNRTILD
jgi:hypothetical protein